MTEQRVKKVVIAGGGTAGWITAAALAKQLGPLLEITLVESEEMGTIGVGESTIPTARTFHRLIGLDEREFMRATKSTFKLGIAFENWGEKGDRYIHSFGQVGHSTWLGGFQHLWLQAQAEGFAGDLGDYCFELQAAEAERFATSDQAKISYAYHLDATPYAAFLRRLSEAAGCTRVEGRIAEVLQHPETCFIEALVLADGRRIDGDLFIDCTGFGALLIGKTLGVGFEDWGHWLSTDSAYVVQTRATRPARPYTRAIAHDAGWRWEIPLQHRIGNGLVYASGFLSDEAARARLIEQLDGEPLTEPRLIRYRTGRREAVWEKNCVAIGLSSGFVEPLESTSIHLIMIAASRLLQSFPFDGVHDALVRRYNALAQTEIEQVRDFIILHYHLTGRDDSAFWRTCRDMDVPETLAQRIALFRDDAQVFQSADELFRVDSWLQVMLGQRLRPRAHHQLGRLVRREQLRTALADLKGNIAQAVAQMPKHQEFLERYCGTGAQAGA